MSTMTDTQPESTVDAKVETVVEDTLPAVGTDANVKLADIPSRLAQILAAANDLPVDKREELDRRAVELAFRDIKAVKKGAEVEHDETVLPRYGQSGVGSLRYTWQRSQLLKGLAAINGAAGFLVYETYSYPNPSSKRRGWIVEVWGTPQDIARTKAMYEVLAQRLIQDAYAPGVVDPKSTAAAQKIARRKWFRDAIDSTLQGIQEIVDNLSDDKVDAALSDRQTAAQAMEGEWRVANAAAEEPKKFPKSED